MIRDSNFFFAPCDLPVLVNNNVIAGQIAMDQDMRCIIELRDPIIWD